MELSDITGPGPIFVVGNPRSGTTLFRLMLTSHPQICIPPEAGFAIWLSDRFGGWSSKSGNPGLFVEALQQTKKFETWSLDRDSVLTRIEERSPTSYSELVSTIYSLYADRNQAGWKRWGDKNNYYLDHIEKIKSLFPNAQFLHIVRDVRDVVCSYIEASTKSRSYESNYAPDLPTDPAAIAKLWSRNNSKIVKSLEALPDDSSLVVRFEDLVKTPETVLREVCRLLTVPYSATMLEYPENNRVNALEPVEFLQWKAHTLSPPMDDRIGRYRNDLTKLQILEVEAVASEMLNFHYS